MNYGYPGANSQFENHNVSEESFWPSFTDIMMVIVMVFLLVTVAVILNNWALISKLTTSIEAQEAASSLADNRQVKNIKLESKLTAMQQNLLALGVQFEEEKTALEQTQAKLLTASAALSTKQETLINKEQELSAKEQSLASIENKLSALNEKFEAEQQRLNNTNQQLSVSNLKLSNTDKELLNIKQQLANKETIITSLDKKLQAAELLAKQQLAKSNQAVVQLQSSLKDTEKEKQSLAQINKTQKTQLADLDKKQTTSTAEIASLKSTIDKNQKATVALQTDQNVMDKKLVELLESVKLAELSLAENEKSAKEKQAKLMQEFKLIQQESDANAKTITANNTAQSALETQLEQKTTEIAKLENTIAESQQTAKAIEAAVTKSEESLKSFEDLLADAEKQLIAKDETIAELKSSQQSGNSQLVSLQGEYDSLDTKYQKLLRPARSSKGKFIASVTYKNVGGKRIVRYKPSPTSSYRTVSKSQLAKNLEALKKKHKENLYIKVVIPKNSGLSYNEAWRFTINLQRKYDYYYND